MQRDAHVFYKWLGLLVAVIVAGASAILGVLDGVPKLHVVFYTLAIFALILWGWHHFSVRWIYRPDAIAVRNAADTRLGATPAPTTADDDAREHGYLRRLIRNNKGSAWGLLALALAFLFSAFAIDGFFQWRNILSVLILIAFIILIVILNRRVKTNKSAVIGIVVLLSLIHI